MEEALSLKSEEKRLICRVCLSYDLSSGKSISLFEKYGNVFVFEKLNYVACIEIKESDDLPDQICSPCLVALNDACNFKAKCENSDTVLRSTSRGNAPILKSFLDLPIKEENEDDCKFEYLDDNILSPSMLQLTGEVKEIYNEAQPIKQRDGFKSKAIDLQLECDDCGKTFKSKCKIRVHWKKVHQPKKLTCGNCKKTFKSYKALYSHTKRRPKTCVNASQLRVEGEGKSRIYHCTMCNANSKRLQTIVTHFVIHTGERPHSCDICSRTFTQHSSVMAHKESAHKLYSKEGTCAECGKYFKGRVNMYRHMRTHSAKRFPCKVCSKVLKTKPSLRQHMRRHSGVKSYTCEMCAKAFYTSSDLSNHKSKQHYKSKVYTCDKCGYKTRNASWISKHRRRHNDSNMACDVCGRFVQNIQQLEMHKKRHFEKNFECIFCNNLYYGRKNFLAHVRRQHKIYATSNSKPSSIPDKITTPAVTQTTLL